MNGSANVASITAVIGATGSGKGVFVKRELRRGKPRRLLIWDPQDEYGDHAPAVASLDGVRQALIAAKGGAFKVRYVPRGDLASWKVQFDAFCQLAYAAGDLWLVCEELGDVTTAGWAPAGWSVITRKGRHRKLKVYGLSQRPAAIDKTFFGNCTTIRCGRMTVGADRKVMAAVLDVPLDEVARLLPLEYIQRDMQTGALEQGKISIEKPRKPARAKAVTGV